MRPDRTLVLLFCAILALLALLLLFLPENAFSMTEKRALQGRPKFGFSKLISGRFSEEIENWYADQFPGREGLVAVRSLTQILTGQKQNNGILLGANGQLARWDLGGDTPTDRVDESRLRAACRGIRRAAETVTAPMVVLLPSRNLDVAESAFDYPNETGKTIRNLLNEELSTVNFANVEPSLRERYEKGENVVFRTDHHWTTLGAYYAYCEVMKAFGREGEIVPREFYREEVVTGGFGGSYRARGGMPFVAKEPISVWYGEDEDDYTITADGKPLDGFYSVPQTGEIGYELFLDGTHDAVTIEKAGEDRPKLVVFKDSFANALAPFLARHFNLVLLNLSSAKKDFTNLSETAAEYGADGVLLVYSVFNLLSADIAARFR